MSKNLFFLLSNVTCPCGHYFCVLFSIARLHPLHSNIISMSTTMSATSAASIATVAVHECFYFINSGFKGGVIAPPP